MYIVHVIVLLQYICAECMNKRTAHTSLVYSTGALTVAVADAAYSHVYFFLVVEVTATHAHYYHTYLHIIFYVLHIYVKKIVEKVHHSASVSALHLSSIQLNLLKFWPPPFISISISLSLSLTYTHTNKQTLARSLALFLYIARSLDIQ